MPRVRDQNTELSESHSGTFIEKTSVTFHLPAVVILFREMKMSSWRFVLPILTGLLGLIVIQAGNLAAALLLPAPETGFGGHNARSYELNDIHYDNIDISGADLNRSILFGRSIINRLQRLETNLIWSDILIEHGTPSHGNYITSSPDEKVTDKMKDAYIASKASTHLMNQFCNRGHHGSDYCAKYITEFSLTSTPLQSACDHMYKTCTEEDMLSKYRSMDGSCNQRSFDRSGESFTGYKRLLFADYLDGIQEPRRSVTKHALPSPRLISTSLNKQFDDGPSGLTMGAVQWGQFISHDLAYTAVSKMIHEGKSIECCARNGNHLSPRYIHPFCEPVDVPWEDEFYSRHNSDCMPYVRSLPAIRADCSFGPLDQLNQATHLLDGSTIYGSTLAKSNNLRSLVNGKLDVSHMFHKQFLPMSLHPTDDCQVNSTVNKCFVSGDSRVNEQPQLTVMHTIWLREHNRLAEELSTINPHWDEETLFQEARRIVIAEIQHITYNEWLPLILGEKYMRKIERDAAFRDNADPSVSNAFATAAFRFLDSMLSNQIKLYSEDRSPLTSLHLRDHFNNPEIIEEPGFLDALVRGQATQLSRKVGINYASDMVNYLFTNKKYGLDRLSLDIQRGRDHGLPSYVQYRKLCGLPTSTQFDQFGDVMPQSAIKLLSKVYESPLDVDLIVGGLLEKPDGDSFLGPTFSCLIADQFLRTRRGDRFFYTNPDQPHPFSNSQLAEIKKVKLARIFCDNADDMKSMQNNVFVPVSVSNKLLDCDDDDIPHMNLKLWNDNMFVYY